MMMAHAARKRGEIGDRVFYLEHPEVITLGRGSEDEDRASLPNGVLAIEVNRGGKATWHGPGQLVGYCVVDLSSRMSRAPDIRAFLEATESGIIDYLKERWGRAAARRVDYTGVWIDRPSDKGTNEHLSMTYPASKIASIGLAVRSWVTYHGFALNLNPDLKTFSQMVPCGIRDAQMTSVENELGTEFTSVSLEAEANILHPYLCRSLNAAGYCKGKK